MARGFNVKLYMELFKRCPANQIRQLRKLEAKHRTYVEKINIFPKELPKIDWEYYKSHVRVDNVQMVDDFQSKYTSFKVPVPTENMSEELNREREEVEKAIDEYNVERCERICELEQRIEEVKATLPFDEMTMEEYMQNYPDDALDFICNPTFWPHLKEEQEVGPPKGAKSDH